MADATVPYQNPTTTDGLLDCESLTVAAQTVKRERIQVAGAVDVALASVVNAAPTTEYGLVVRNIPSGTQAISASNLDVTLSSRLSTLGQKAMASSAPMVIASDQTAIPASQSGTWNVGTVTSITNPIAVTGTFYQVTQPVSAVSLPLPANAAIETGGNLDTIVARLAGGISIQTLAPIQVANADGTPITVNATGSDLNSIVNPVTVNQGTANATPWNINHAQTAGAVPSSTNGLYVSLTDQTAPYSTDVIGANRYLKVSAVQDIEVSTVNGSTTNIAANASFTGVSATTLGVAAIQVCVFTDQNCTIQVQQSQTDPGVNWDMVDAWTYAANSTSSDSARTIQAMGASARLVVTNNGQQATTLFRCTTVMCPVADTLPRGLTQLGNLRVAVQESVLPSNAAKESGGALDSVVALMQVQARFTYQAILMQQAALTDGFIPIELSTIGV